MVLKDKTNLFKRIKIIDMTLDAQRLLEEPYFSELVLAKKMKKSPEEMILMIAAILKRAGVKLPAEFIACVMDCASDSW